MSRIEVMSGIERRRRWSADEKRRLVSAAFSPGAVVSEVARRADIHPNQLYRWRHELRSFSPGFAELVVTGDFPPAVPATVSDPTGTAMIEVVIADRTRLRLPVSTSPTLATAVIGALVRNPVLGEDR
jgi:transposase